jgi:hypothetical protein
MCSDKSHHFRVSDRSAPAILNRLGRHMRDRPASGPQASTSGHGLWNIGRGSSRRWAPLNDLPMPTDKRVVPDTCPIRWSVRDRHGHPRTDWQTCRPASQHVESATDDP